MLVREEEREKLGEKPNKYHGKWPFRRVFGIQVGFLAQNQCMLIDAQLHEICLC